MNKDFLKLVLNKKFIIIFNAIYFIFTLFPLCEVASQSSYVKKFPTYNAWQMGILGIVWIILPAAILLLITIFEKKETVKTDLVYIIVTFLGIFGAFGAPKRYNPMWGYSTNWCLFLYVFYIVLFVIRILKARNRNMGGE